MAAEYSYTDLQVRILDAEPGADEAGLAAVTVRNSGDEDGVEQVRWFVTTAGGERRELGSSRESLEVDHSHRVRRTLSGDDLLAGATAPVEVTVEVGPSADDVRASATVTLA